MVGFGDDGKLLPIFFEWFIKSDQANRAAWFLKEKMLSTVYCRLILKGRDWLAKPGKLNTTT